jgi:hypothetical protein
VNVLSQTEQLTIHQLTNTSIMDSQNWRTNFFQELSQAEEARNEGNEGKARVCARRAAGIVLGEYFARRGITDLSPGAFDRLKYFSSLSDISQQEREICEHFLVRVLPDHNLPVEADLIADARWLEKELLSKKV